MKQKIDQKKVGIVTAAVIVVLAAVIIITALCRNKDESYRSIKIVELSGSVSINRDGIGKLDAAENMNLVSGDYVTTDKDAYVVLRLDTDKYVMLGEAGAMKVVAEGDENSAKTSIQLDQGSVLNEIQNPLGQGSSYEIVTPNATMSVRGTVFEVRKEQEGDGNISVLVYDGSVAVGLDGKEPVLYKAGEYTMFTDEASPDVLVERGTVSEEVLDSRVRQRLQQMESQGRSLNTGSVNLSEDAPVMTETPAPAATPVVTVTPAPAATPVVTAAPEPTVTPAVTASPVPTVTPAPTATPTVTASPVPVVTPEVTEAPAPEPGEEDEEEEEAPEPTAVPTASPAPTPTPVAPTPTLAPPQEGYCRISYEIPYVLLSGKEPENADEAKNIKKAHEYGSSDIKKGDTVWEQKNAEVTSIPNHEELKDLGFEFVGWYKADGFAWNFKTDAIMVNTVLYPVWKDKDGNLYKVKVSEEFGVCYSIKEEPSGTPSPAPSEEPSVTPSPAPSEEPAGTPAPSNAPAGES